MIGVSNISTAALAGKQAMPSNALPQTTFSGTKSGINRVEMPRVSKPLFGQRLNAVEQEAQALIDAHWSGREPFEKAGYEAGWDNSTQGSEYRETPDGPTNEERVIQIDQDYIDFKNNPEFSARIEALWAKRDEITIPEIARALKFLHDNYDGATRYTSEKKALGQLGQALQSARAKESKTWEWKGEPIGVGKLVNLRATVSDPKEMKALWNIANGLGTFVMDEKSGKTFAEGALNLFLARNHLADLRNRDTFGDDQSQYMDAYTWALHDQEIDEASLVRLTNEVEEATREPYRQLTEQFDAAAAEHFGIPKTDARQSWFQTGYGSATNMGNLNRLTQFDPDQYFEGLDVERSGIDTAALQGRGDEMAQVYENSQYTINGVTKSALFFDSDDMKRGKRGGAFATISNDPPRTLQSVNPDLKTQIFNGAVTCLHEAGHSKDGFAIEIHLDKPRPSGIKLSEGVRNMLRGTHLTTSESHAFINESLVTDRNWLLTVPKKKDGTPLFDEEKADEFLAVAIPYIRLEKLSNIRITASIMEFERLAYHHLTAKQKKRNENAVLGLPNPKPDPQETIQELNDIWWDCRERFMMEKRPTGEEAKKSGWVSVPHYFHSTAYYPNYFQAEPLRAMKAKYIKENFGSLLTPEAQKWLDTFLVDGDLHTWDKLIEMGFGEPLNAKALKEEFSQVRIPQYQPKQ